MQMIDEILKKNEKQSKIIESQWKRILRQIKEEIKDNRVSINKMLEIDKKHYKKQVSIEELIEQVEKYEKEEVFQLSPKTYMYSYYGDPIITINLLIKSIQNNTKAIFAIEDFMLAINTILIAIVNNVLEDNNIDEMFILQNLLDVKEVKAYSIKIDKIICIGNSFNFELYKKNKIKNVEYESFNTIDIFCDSESLEELQKKIYEYCQEEYIEIEVYHCEDIDEAIELFNLSSASKGVLLTKNKNNIQKAKDKIKNIKMIINKNPFEQQNFEKLDKYFY